MPLVLNIEDSNVVRTVMTKLLRKHGCDVVEAAGQVEALELYQKQRPDAVFLDWDLPGLTALDVLRGIGTMARKDHPPIVLCITENDPRQLALARAVGAKFHLLKPYEATAVGGVLDRAGLTGAANEAECPLIQSA